MFAHFPLQELLEKHLIPKAKKKESQVFYMKMMGDYYRYKAEVASEDKCKAGKFKQRTYFVCVCVCITFVYHQVAAWVPLVVHGPQFGNCCHWKWCTHFISMANKGGLQPFAWIVLIG